MRKTLLTFIAVFFAVTGWAQSEFLTLKALAKQSLTGDAMGLINVYLTSSGTTDTIVGESSFKMVISGNYQEKQQVVRFKVPRVKKVYTLTAEAEGYETISRPVEISHIGKRTSII